MKKKKEDAMVYPDLSYRIIESAFAVHQSVGPGLLEVPYRNALFLDLQQYGLLVEKEMGFQVQHLGKVVGEYRADLIIERKVIIEVKSVSGIEKTHQAQLMNYLHLSGCCLGFVINFRQERLQWQRMVCSQPPG